MAPNNSIKATLAATLEKNPVVQELSQAEDDALGYFNADAAIELPNGTFLVGADCARDQASMRAAQLAGLLSLMNVDSGRGFLQLNDISKQHLLWMAAGLADELKAVLPLATMEAERLAGVVCGGAA